MSNYLRDLMALAAMLLFTAAWMSCSSENKPESTLTRRQRDSVLAESRLPGAQGVKTTITVADTANARTRRLNKLAE